MTGDAEATYLSTRRGYDLWSGTYDEDPNPLITLDRWHTRDRLAAQPGELILDAGCGTGGHFQPLIADWALPVGADLSHGMLTQARRQTDHSLLVQCDVAAALPFRSETFDAVLCSLVSEHLESLPEFFTEVHRVLRAPGRLAFSGLHPDRAHAGVEANFESDGSRFRMTANAHTIDDFVRSSLDAGLRIGSVEEFVVDDRLVDAVPKATKYLGLPLLFVMVCHKD